MSTNKSEKSVVKKGETKKKTRKKAVDKNVVHILGLKKYCRMVPAHAREPNVKYSCKRMANNNFL